MRQAKNLHWVEVESLLEHLGRDEECEKEDSAQWLSFYRGKNYNGPFTLDWTSALVIWSDANINYTRQKKLLCHTLVGRCLFISEMTTFCNVNEHYYVLTYYDICNQNQNPKLSAYTRLNSLIASGYCTIIAGADKEQGGCRAWITISTMGGTEVRERLETNDNDPKESCIISQVGHINCKQRPPWDTVQNSFIPALRWLWKAYIILTGIC